MSSVRPMHLLWNWIPSVAVLSTLGGIAWLGHHYEWKLPKFSQLTASLTDAEPTWCDSHGVPEEDCIACQPDLIEGSPELTFCEEHGVKGCVLCHPELAQTKEPVQPTPSDFRRASRALALIARKENLSASTSPGTRIQFASIESVTKAGVDVELVERHPIIERVMAAGEVRYDATRTAVVSPPSDGIVQKVLVEVGEWIEAGNVLAIIDSQEVGRLKSELTTVFKQQRLHQQTVDRLQGARDSIPLRRLLDTQNELQAASAKLEAVMGSLGNLGILVNEQTLSPLEDAELADTIDRLGHDAIPANAMRGIANQRNLVAIVAPLSGRVVSRELTMGQVVARGSECFRIVDTRRMWLDLRVASEDAALIALGQEVGYMSDGSVQPREGQVTWISSDVDPQTRTVRVRAELPNEDGMLRNESFGKGSIVLRDEADAIVIPEESLHWDGTGHLVFVRDARYFEKDRPKFFIARSVRLGAKQDGYVEILSGVLPGEVVVTRGGDVLRAQLLKSHLGAGCTCGH